jgi:6-phosphogluconate dehydrogenase
MQIGMIGLGKMGMNMARRLMTGRHGVIVYDRNEGKIREAEAEGAIGAQSLKDMAGRLSTPRVIWIMVTAGAPVDDMIDAIKIYLGPGDVIVDGGNSHYRDDIRRASTLGKSGIRYMDVGVSGGIWGLERGYCLMAGGDQETYDLLKPAFETLAPPGGFGRYGDIGAGHFVKMVHNGIEYAMMEAYGEGFELIKKSPYGASVDMADLARLWNRGSVVRSWLLELLEGALGRDKDLSGVAAHVEDSGEGRWTVQEAIDLGVPVPAIADSLFRRFRSRDPESFAEKVMAALRKEFGGHAVKSKPD